MTEKEWTKTLRAAYDEETPDLLDGILKDCHSTAQADGTQDVSVRRRFGWVSRVAALAACIVLFFVGLAVGHFLPVEDEPSLTPPQEPKTVLYMDINPSIEMHLDAAGRVLNCLPGNADAEAVLAGLELVGAERNAALADVLTSVYRHGYLSESSNAILISVDEAEDDGTEGQDEDALQQITDEINAVFADLPMACSVIAQHVQVSEELKRHAEELEVSVGKLYLVEKMADGLEVLKDIDVSRLAELSVSQLSLLYSNYIESGLGKAFADDVVSGAVSGFVEMGEAVRAQLAQLDIAEWLLEEYTAGTEYREIEGEARLVYHVSLKIKYVDVACSFSVDCESGELLEIDFDAGALADLLRPSWGK